MTQFPLKTIFVLGKARCGSTLLGRMLGTHSKVLSFGEIMWTDLSLQDGRTCSCGAVIDSCPFWSRHLPKMRSVSGLKYRKFTPALYHDIAKASGKEIALDLSKTRVWRSLRWPPNLRWMGRADYGFIFLVRDSRGVVASAIRRGKDFDQIVKMHFKWMKRFYRFIAGYGERALLVRYEDLCADPRKELERICKFMRVDFEEQCLNPDLQEHHQIRCSKSDYLKNQNKIEKDERWKTELTLPQIAIIEAEMAKTPFLKQIYLLPR